MIRVRCSVKVTNQEHPRAGQAGVVVANGEEADQWLVRFDADQPNQADEAITAADLVVICEN